VSNNDKKFDEAIDRFEQILMKKFEEYDKMLKNIDSKMWQSFEEIEKAVEILKSKNVKSGCIEIDKGYLCFENREPQNTQQNIQQKQGIWSKLKNIFR